MAITPRYYDNALAYILNGTINLATDTFKVALLNSSHAFDATDDQWADVSANEIANGLGYTTGGAILGSVAVSEVDGDAKFSFANPSWTASGGALPAVSHAVIYSDTSSGDKLICSIPFTSAITVPDGSALELNIDPTFGLFTVEQ